MPRGRRDMTGTARCLDCSATAEYAGDRTLVIHHRSGCPNLRAESEACDRGTPGCSTNHRFDEECETW